MAGIGRYRGVVVSMGLGLAAAAGCRDAGAPGAAPGAGSAAGAQAGPPAGAAARPKLVVVVVIDQFRADYLTRFEPHFGDAGFRRLARSGAAWTGHYGHYATYTGPGHALVLSGSYPYVNGIAANKFYNAQSQRSEAMVFDAEAEIIGVKKTDPDNDVSPRNFVGSTLGDELSLASAGRSRTVAIATKGRGAILLGGRLGKAYFMNDDTGEMTTSTYYASVLPNWVVGWNAKKLADASFGKTWDRALPEAAYVLAGPDDAKAEGDSKGLGKTFPHKVTGKLQAPGADYYEAFTQTPFANDLEFDFAKAAVENEQLGGRDAVDLLAISLSAIDLAGHTFGPSSQEVEDLVVRLDRQLGAFLDWLYARLGPQNVLTLVTADHGATPVPEQMAALGFEAGRIKKKTIGDAVEAALVARFGPPGAGAKAPPKGAAPKEGGEKAAGDKWVVALEDPHVFLNRAAIAAKKLDPHEVEQVAGQAAASLKGFGGYFTRTQLLHGAVPQTPLGLSILRSYHAPRGGDVVLWTLPFYFWGKYGEKDVGSTHGTFYRYDSEVPVLLSGPGVRPGRYGVREMVDVAPTLSQLLGLTAPAASEGAVVPVAD
ncbi:MAG TPA: alkaline phosphatase family protein [Polyangiaceae bacterium]|nr:alkaline phosphatase family protein [Polyangiaceae bacterium]